MEKEVTLLGDPQVGATPIACGSEISQVISGAIACPPPTIT